MADSTTARSTGRAVSEETVCGSALLLETVPTVPAGDGDSSLAPGNPELLPAVGASEIAVLLVPVYGATQPQPGEGGTRYLHELPVFGGSLLQIAGEEAEDRGGQQKQREPVEDRDPDKEVHDIENNIECDQKEIQLVVSVAAHHEALQRIPNHKGSLLAMRKGGRAAALTHACIISFLARSVKKADVNNL